VRPRRRTARCPQQHHSPTITATAPGWAAARPVPARPVPGARATRVGRRAATSSRGGRAGGLVALRLASPRTAIVVALVLVALGVAACGSGGGGASTTPVGLVPIGAGVRGPTGLAATVYATGIPTASAFAIDSSGRLWVAASAASDHRKDGVYLVARAGARP